LIALHELFSEVSIFTGWHAIEFLLWGQDLSTTGPGNRQYTDYIQGAGGTAANQVRRIQYLQVASNLLMEHLQQMQAEWQPGASYPEDLINGKTTGEALGLLFFGLREFTITEVAGERMFVAIDTKDQEHEHSCFADNTNADLLMNIKGIKNVYFGTYQNTDGTIVSGKSFSDLVLLVDKSKDDAVRAAFLDAETKMNAIPAPFDQAILNNKDLIEAAIAATENLGMRLAEAGKAIGAEF
jgi:putative iron-regulated protein